jgi:phenylalanyl-tRNA synthetase beta chain
VRVPLGWLRDYVDFDLSPEALAERLTLLGFEVKGLERWGSEWRNVVVGELLTVEKHPRADRLSLTTVRVGAGEPLQIVCGATNIAPGQRVPVALPGALLPGNRAIERTEKMGVASNGMLCSGDELRLSVEGEGILILPVGTPLGASLTDLYGDWVLDVDVKPNRGDALCLVGLAREVAAATGSVARFPEITLREDGPAIGEVLAVGVDDPELCHRFVGRRVNGVRVAPSPEEVQRRLLAAGMRPVSNVVDATNYAMLELGKPTHAFDAGAVARDARGRAALVVRTARPGERLETLDHVERTLFPETLVIADENGPLAIAGVMGGAASEVGESTADVIIESAVFDPVSVRRTAFRYALRSEASLRFEKGQESRLARIGADRVAELIAAWAGGRVAAGRIDSAPDEPTPGRVGYRPARVDRLLGTSLGAGAQAALLARVGIATEPAPDGSGVVIAAGATPRIVPVAPGEARDAVVPTWRRDLLIEADIAEEVVRLAGYEAVAGKTPDTAMPHVRPNPLELRDALRRALVGAGLTEVVTPALVPASQAAALGWPILAADGVPGEAAVDGRVITVTNPLSERHAVLRRSLVGSLLDVLALNERHGRGDVAIFEVGKGYAQAPDGAPAEWWRLAFLVTGSAGATAWNLPARQYDLDDAKGIVELLARVLALPDPAYAPHLDGPPLHPGRAARTVVPAALAGLIGELHPSVLAAWDLRADRVLVAELAISGLSAGQLAPIRVVPVGRFQPLERDLALVVPEPLAAADLAATLRAAGGDTLRQVALFDIYRGAPLAAGEKSLAWRVVFAADERALTDEEVDADVARLVSAVASAHGARLRT